MKIAVMNFNEWQDIFIFSYISVYNIREFGGEKARNNVDIISKIKRNKEK